MVRSHRFWCVLVLFALTGVPAGAQTPFERLFEPRTAVSIILEMPQTTWGPIAAEPPQGGPCAFMFTGNRYNWHNANITVVTERDTVISQQLYTNAGIKKKSFCGSLHNTKPSLTIDLAQFNSANEALANAQLGTKHLSLENSLQDPDLFRQCAGYYTFRSMGLPAPMCSFAALYRRDPNTQATFIGLYVLTERVKKDFFRRRPAIDNVPTAGSLYEFERLDDFTQVTLTQQLQVEWSLTSNQDFAFAVNQFQSAQQPATVLAKTVDLPSFIDYWATEIFLKHWDGYTNHLNNVFVYDDTPPASPIQKTRFRFIPHGVDQILKVTTKPVVYQQSLVAQRAYADNGLRYQLHRVLAEYGSRITAADVQGQIESYVPLVLHLWRGNDPILFADSNLTRQKAETVKVAINQAIVDIQSVFGQGLMAPTFTPKRVECPFFVQCLTRAANPELGRAWCTTQANQQWIFESLPQSMGSLGFPDPLKIYAVRNAGTNDCIEVGAQFADGSNRWKLQMATCSASNAAQHFFLVRREGRGFELRSFVRNGCAHFSGSVVTTDGRPAVYLSECHNESKELLVAEP